MHRCRVGEKRRRRRRSEKVELPKEKYVEGGEQTRWSPPKLRDLKTSRVFFNLSIHPSVREFLLNPPSP